MKILENLQKMVDELNTTNSSSQKVNILKKHESEWNQTFLKYTYSSFIQFGIKSDNLKKRKDLILEGNLLFSDREIIPILDRLSKRDVTGYNAIKLVNRFIKDNPEHEELIYNILDKNLKTRTDEKLINKAFPNLIPTFEVALANDYKDCKNRINLSEGWLVSRKLDGCRCVILKNEETKALSRAGKEFETLQVLIDEINKLSINNVVFDGEVCLMDGDNESFSDIMKEIRRKNHTIQNPRYKLIDLIPYEDFMNKKSDKILKDRLNDLNKIIPKDNKYLEVLNQNIIYNEEELQPFIEKSNKEGWEGLIIRKNTSYEGKRTNNMLKIKEMNDAEYKIKDVVVGSIRYIDKETGLEKEVEALSAVIIEHKGFEVKVGSGWTMDQRLYYKEHKDELIGKIITVQYFEETKNQNGTLSLRFPIVKVIYGKEREI